MPLPIAIYILADDPLHRSSLEMAVKALRANTDVVGCFSCGLSKAPYCSDMLLAELGITHIATSSAADIVGKAGQTSSEIAKRIGKRPVICVLSAEHSHVLLVQAMRKMGSPCWAFCGANAPEHYSEQCAFAVRMDDDLDAPSLQAQIRGFLQSLPVMRKKPARAPDIPKPANDMEIAKLGQISEVLKKASFRGMTVSTENLSKIAKGKTLFELLDKLNDVMYEKYRLLPSVLHIDKNSHYEVHFFNRLRSRWHKRILNGITERVRFVELEKRKVGTYYRKKR